MKNTKELLARYGLNASKSLGQNFLCDGDALESIVNSADIDEKPVLEIGPGLGELTVALAKRASCVVAVEIDQRMTEVLRDRLAPYPNTEVIYADFLRVKLDEIYARLGERPFHVVANLPYYITTPISTRLVTSPLPIEGMCLMVQAEAAERFSAPPRARVYGHLSVMTQARYNVETVLRLSPSSYYPRPDVDSAVITLKSRGRVLPNNLDGLVRAAFAGRRKTLVNALSSAGYDKSDIAAALSQLNIREDVRAEAICVEEFMLLANALKK